LPLQSGGYQFYSQGKTLMNLYSMLQERAKNENIIRVGLIGTGKASIAARYLPPGLAQNVTLKDTIADACTIALSDVGIDESTRAFEVHRWM